MDPRADFVRVLSGGGEKGVSPGRFPSIDDDERRIRASSSSPVNPTRPPRSSSPFSTASVDAANDFFPRPDVVANDDLPEWTWTVPPTKRKVASQR
jgi:hypothetical protein